MSSWIHTEKMLTTEIFMDSHTNSILIYTWKFLLWIPKKKILVLIVISIEWVWDCQTDLKSSACMTSSESVKHIYWSCIILPWSNNLTSVCQCDCLNNLVSNCCLQFKQKRKIQLPSAVIKNILKEHLWR